jgi:hypothetical protein
MLHTTNTLIYFEFYFFKKANIQGFKICFSMNFLNTKIIFLQLGFYNMFVNSKRC